MRYAVLSDIHGNLEALEAVLGELTGEKIDEYLCIGDVVGYGADPAQCIKIIRSLTPAAFVSGNHEWGTAGFLELDYFNEYARRAVEWTRGALSCCDIDYLKSSKLICEYNGFTLVHGGLKEPSKFPYIVDSQDAYSNMSLMNNGLCFIAHTHIAEIYRSVKGGAIRLEHNSFKIEEGVKYVVNVGSVGQPRDMDPRASYAVFDSAEERIEIKRVCYDFTRTQAKILKAGLPEMFALRLSEGR